MSETLRTPEPGGLPFATSRADPREDDPLLPAPERERFTPLRAGILNLWQYDEQELRFHQGRLLLRGENGTGKSKALEVLLPFLLDADLSPHRLDPFASTARTMYWNLLEGGKHESRVGYVWMEVGRLAEPSGGGEPRPLYRTLGCGLRATRRTRRVDSWFFVTSRRVGGGLELTSPAGVPLLKDELTRALAEDGAVYGTGKDYRARVDQELFGLGEDRFDALRHLLLQLRRPQLSQKLDPASLSELLAESLPPVEAELVGQLSEGFERLEGDARELARVEAAAREVEGFLEVYRTYARGVARGRAAEVRRADSAYHRNAAEAREAEGERDALARELTELSQRRETADGEAARSRGTLRALEQSDAMRSAEALTAKREHADALEAHAREAERGRQRAERQAELREEERERARGELERAREVRAERLREADDDAATCGLGAAHAAAVDALPGDPDAARATVAAAVRRRREGVEELTGLAAECEETRAAWVRREERRQDAEARLRAAAERARNAERRVAREEEALAEALARWAGDLSELEPADDDLALLHEAASSGSGLEAALRRLEAPRRDALVAERTGLEGEAREAEAERANVAEERRGVAEAREIPPEPPRTRLADRAGRPGAPFYLLVDFAADLPERERAGLEAALEAAGLLDAWVSPGGELLDPETYDTVLAPTPEARMGRDADAGEDGGPSTLADALVAVPGHGVERDVIEALLRTVALAPAPDPAPGHRGDDRSHQPAAGQDEPPDGPSAEAPAGAAATRVGPDGTFHLGPVHGAWAKDEAEHVGAAAREAARLRRLETLDRELAGLDRRLEEVAGRRATVEERLARLEEEVSAAPADAPLRQAREGLQAAVADETRRRDELAAAEDAAGAARKTLEEAEALLRRRARELDLPERLDALRELPLRIQAFDSAFTRLLEASEAARTAEGRAETARELAEETAAERERLERTAEEAARRAASARAEHESLEATAGHEAREVLERHAREGERLEELESELERLAREREALLDRRARAEERLRLKAEELETRDAERGRTVERLRRLAAAGLLPLVLEGAGGGGEGDGAHRTEEEDAAERGALTLTRALELAREIERATGDVDVSPEAGDLRANRLHARYQQLLADLGPDFQPSLLREEELEVVRFLHNGEEHDAPALLRTLREGAETRRALLADHERDLLRRFLLGEVGDHLRTRLRQARELVAGMNELLAECPTASGMVLRLAWRPAGEARAEVREALEVLQKDPTLLADGERRRLESFFLGRIEEARERWEAVPWRDHLMRALDYRRWHEFRVLRRAPQDDGWTELTRMGHAAASGGEKAVALHLPLFAAAKAHYLSARPTAPRLVMLDEAFAGIDRSMRGRCMKLLVDFDLDFMMTSHDEWGCYRELPGLAIYQLYRDPALEGVGAVRFVWSGGRLYEEA